MRYEDAKNYDEAIANFSKALEMDQNNPDAWLGKARITLMMVEKNDLSIKEIESYIENAIQNGVEKENRFTRTFELFSQYYAKVVHSDYLKNEMDKFRQKRKKLAVVKHAPYFSCD